LFADDATPDLFYVFFHKQSPFRHFDQGWFATFEVKMPVATAKLKKNSCAQTTRQAGANRSDFDHGFTSISAVTTDVWNARLRFSLPLLPKLGREPDAVRAGVGVILEFPPEQIVKAA
jgi:hypothetical protein